MRASLSRAEGKMKRLFKVFLIRFSELKVLKNKMKKSLQDVLKSVECATPRRRSR
jgi:hypothetical protein